MSHQWDQDPAEHLLSFPLHHLLGPGVLPEQTTSCVYSRSSPQPRHHREPYSEHKPSWFPIMTSFPLCLPVERDRTLDYQEPHWKEFRFDLTQIPAGEVVTAAEFRIYKEPSTHPLNTTLHVTMFEVVQERSNRYLPSAQGPTPFMVSWSRLWQGLTRGCISQKGKGVSWERHLRHKKGAWPGTLRCH